MDVRPVFGNRSIELESGTYPKRTPPNATNNPIMIAGAAEPTASSGLFKAKPIVNVIR